MAAPPARPLRLAPHTRAAAWLATGPVGHLVAGVADWAYLYSSYLWSRARGRDPWRPR